MRIRALDLVDVFVHLVVLGAFIQVFPQVISESFLVALLTAVLLKVVLEVVTRLKKAVVARIRTATTPLLRVLGVLALFCVMAGSKFVVLELTALLFGDAVHLGGFLSVTALILCLMGARAGTRSALALVPEDTGGSGGGSGGAHEGEAVDEGGAVRGTGRTEAGGALRGTGRADAGGAVPGTGRTDEGGAVSGAEGPQDRGGGEA